MDNKELNQLREIAFEVTIDPKNKLHAANAEDVIKVLNAYISSYKSYLAIKLKSEDKSDQDIEKAIKETQLLVVDTEFNSYHNCLAPYNPNSSSPIILFDDYKKEVLETDVDNYIEVKKLRDDFTKEELYSIFNPIFLATSSNYNLKIKTGNGVERKVKKPTTNFATYFKPAKEKQKKVNESKLFQVYVQSQDLKTISKKDIIFSSELEYETYPYKIDRIFYADKQIYLHDSITCKVEYSDDLYFISYDTLNIEVWGDSRKQAEDAFDFTFYSLVINYVDENDSNLTRDAIVLKNMLTTMIRTIK